MIHDAAEELETTVYFLLFDVFMARLCIKIASEHSSIIVHYVQVAHHDILLPIMISVSAFSFFEAKA